MDILNTLSSTSMIMIPLFIILFVILIAAVVTLKGYALWHAAKRNEVGWFIALLIVNTIGILEIIYLYFIVGKWSSGSDSGSDLDSNSNQNQEKDTTIPNEQ